MRKGQPFRPTHVCCGRNGDGPTLAQEAQVLLRATYLRPLRDAEQAMSSGRGSRLAQVLHHTNQITSVGVGYDPKVETDPKALNVLGIGDLANALLEKQQGILDTRTKVDAHLKALSLHGSNLKSSIKVSSATASEDIRLRHLLEKLDLRIEGEGKLGLGSDNVLFMACELLLLAQEDEGNKLLLIEEPEAHLHPQRQLRVMQFLQEQAKKDGIQIIVTTHSPNLASAIALDNLVMIRGARPFSLARTETELTASDYSFLERFLDVTKANLFFARGVMIVEGDAENILIPTLGSLLGADFTERGVSLVNVGGVGLRRYARIFQRKDVKKDGQLTIPVACITDMDVMPDCAPVIVGKLNEGAPWPDTAHRKWRAKKDLAAGDALNVLRSNKETKASGQYVKTFVSDEWTLEYDLALGPKDKAGSFSAGLAEDVFVAARLAANDEAIHEDKRTIADVEATALSEFASMKSNVQAKDGCTVQEVLASQVYAMFADGTASKAIAAQYLAERLRAANKVGKLTSEELRNRLPTYLTAAIDYVTGVAARADAVTNNQVAPNA
jgi:putative ATP-dependent endonuclease of OLD family